MRTFWKFVVGKLSDIWDLLRVLIFKSSLQSFLQLVEMVVKPLEVDLNPGNVFLEDVIDRHHLEIFPLDDQDIIK